MPINTASVASAALEAAGLEEGLIFEGMGEVSGLLNSKGALKLKLSSWEAMGKAVEDAIGAITLLDKAGFHGPYTLALAPERYNQLFRRYPQGGTELEYLQALGHRRYLQVPGSGKRWNPYGIGEARYASIVLGQDMTLGYNGPVGENLEFSVSESLALLIREPRAICVLG